MLIRALSQDDFESWRPVWEENMQQQVGEAVTMNTWRALCDKHSQVFGLGVFEEDQLAGILHYILHPTTGSINPVCYMQDLFIAPPHRRKGYAKALLKALERTGREKKWNRIYWIASEDNKSAQKLYEDIGVRLNFSIHVLPLNMDF